MSTELTQLEQSTTPHIKKRRKKKKERLHNTNITALESKQDVSCFNQQSIQIQESQEPKESVELQTPLQTADVQNIKQSDIAMNTTPSKATLSLDAIHSALLDVVENSTVSDFERFELNAGGFQNALVLYSIISDILLHNGIDTLTEQQINQIIKSKGLDLPEFIISKQYPKQKLSDELDDYYIPYIFEPALHFAIIVILVDIILFGTSTSFCTYLSTLINSTVEGTFLLGNYYISIKGLYCLLIGIFNIISFTYIYHKMVSISKKEVI